MKLSASIRRVWFFFLLAACAGVASSPAQAQCFGACWFLCPGGSGLAISCSETTQTGCTLSGGTFKGCDTNCSNGPGACCTQSCCLEAECTDGLVPSECTALGGSSQGVCSSCATLLGGGCFRACCFSGETCTEYRPNDCVALGGSVYPLETYCNPFTICDCETGTDFDGDDRRGSCDCDAEDGSVWSRATEVAGLTLTRDVPGPDDVRVAWDTQDPVAGPGTTYDVARGSLSTLRSGGYPGGAVCAQDDAADTPYDEGASSCSPASRDGCWYLARGQNQCRTGTYGSGTNGDTLDPAGPCP